MSLLPWQTGLAQRLEALMESSRLPHGIVITASEGWGEIEFARWLALRLLGASLTLDPSEVAHPDLRWIKPDGAEIKVDAIREVGEFAFKTSHRGGRKVVVLEDAHLLNRNAANALLKTLEEPPEDTFVILASCHPGRLLPTIRSRCQRFVIRPDAQLGRAWLGDQWGASEIDERWQASGGAPLLVAAELLERRPPLDVTLDEIAISERPLACLDDLLARDPDQLTGAWYRHIRGMLAHEAGDSAAGDIPARSLLEFSDELLWVRHQMVNTNSANDRLLLGRLIVRWHGLRS